MPEYTAGSPARKGLFPLIKKVNEDHNAIEIVSRHGNAVLVSAEDYAALREGAYLQRSPANARRPGAGALMSLSRRCSKSASVCGPLPL
jgi:prevent-host-death family protein